MNLRFFVMILLLFPFVACNPSAPTGGYVAGATSVVYSLDGDIGNNITLCYETLRTETPNGRAWKTIMYTNIASLPWSIETNILPDNREASVDFPPTYSPYLYVSSIGIKEITYRITYSDQEMRGTKNGSFGVGTY